MSRKILFTLLGIMVVVSMILTACASSPAPTTASATSAPATTSAPKTTAPATSAAPAPTQTAAPAKTYTIKAISFAARNIFSVSGIFTLAEKVKELSKGQLTIQYLGGPEIIPVFQQAEAVRKNVVNMSVIPATMYDGLVPLGNLMEISELTFEEELKAGVIDYYNTLHEKAGLHLLGYATHAATPTYHTMILNKLITKPQELAGVKMGAGSTLLVPFLKKIGAVPVIVPLADVYTNLERKVMDGYSVPITNHADLQLHEVTKYIIDHNFYQAAGVFIINADTWKELPQNLKDVMVEAAKFSINKYTEDYKVQQAAARKKLMDGGMTTIKFSDADLKWFIDTLYSSAWEENAKLVPEQTAKLKPLIQKSGK